MIEINVDQPVEQLRQVQRDMLAGDYTRAIRTALNDSITRGRSRLASIILQHYNETAFTPTAVRSGLIIERARQNNLTARIYVSGKPLSLSYFSPRKTAKGITVEVIKGRRKLLKSAFRVQFGGSGRSWVVAKGKYAKGGFEWRKERVKPYPASDLPVSRLVSVSLPGTVMSDQVGTLQELGQDLERYYPTRLEYHVNAIQHRQVNPRVR
jgi:hypothetical protein